MAGKKPNCFSTRGFTIPPFTFLRSFTSTQDEEDASCQEHCRDNCCEIQIDLRCQSASCMRLPWVEPQLPNAVNFWPTRHRAGTRGVRWCHPIANLVGYGANVRKQSHRVRPENAWQRFQSLQGH